ncbi:MAG TPA: GNAT family N-acetyltransferase [Acidimicrobiales bacterium]|nr:GNAT family N-acetyltransferase [Acidimicrobiales bacterium]
MSMTAVLRPITTDELPALQTITSYAFGGFDGGPAPWINPDWTMCAFVDGRLATTFGAWPFRVRLNGRSVAMAGITMVATLPEYRRRGLLRQVMIKALAEQRDRGQAIAILWASMGAIYQRYGFGLASSTVSYDIDPRRIQFADGGPAAGTVRLHSREEARPIFEEVFKEFSRPRNLVIQRAGAMWDIRQAGDRKEFGVYRDVSGAPRGFVAFDTGTDPERSPNQTITINDWAAMDADAYRGLWEFFGAHDLVGWVRWTRVPEDDPAPFLFLEPRELHRRTADGIWMRVTDVVEALPQRPYGDADALTIAVRDDVCPWNDGTYVLETTGEESTCRRIDATPDLTMPASSLAVLLSGHRSASMLARAGRVEAGDARALARADRLFATHHAPWCNDDF